MVKDTHWHNYALITHSVYSFAETEPQTSLISFAIGLVMLLLALLLLAILLLALLLLAILLLTLTGFSLLVWTLTRTLLQKLLYTLSMLRQISFFHAFLLARRVFS